VDPSVRESLEAIRRTWLAESDEALFEALTAGRAKYTTAALGVIADEAARRGLTRPERMKQLAEMVKRERAALPPEPEPPLPPLDFVPELQKALGLILALGMMIGVRLFIRWLFR
jgi:hypothetical protein